MGVHTARHNTYANRAKCRTHEAKATRQTGHKCRHRESCELNGSVATRNCNKTQHSKKRSNMQALVAG